MTTHQMNMINWSKTLPLDRRYTTSVYRDLIDSSISPNPGYSTSIQSKTIKQYQTTIDDTFEYKSLIKSTDLKRNLAEARQVFLGLDEGKIEAKSDDVLEPNKELEFKKSTRKISFKCKKPSSYRRATITNSKVTTTLNPNTVSELTSKFNKIVAERNSILEQPKFARLVRRVNSQKGFQEEGTNKKVTRKPSVKIKPVIKSEDKIVPVTQRTSKNFNNQEASVKKTDEAIQILGCENMGNVRATIEIFERRTSQSSPSDIKIFAKEIQVPKPKVPEKNPNIKAKDLVIKNGVKKLKVYEKREMDSNDQNDTTNNTNLVQSNTNNQVLTETKTEIQDQVQILSIPLVMPRKCESMYETLNLKRCTFPSRAERNRNDLESNVSPKVPLVNAKTSSKSPQDSNNVCSILLANKCTETNTDEKFAQKNPTLQEEPTSLENFKTVVVLEEVAPKYADEQPESFNLENRPISNISKTTITVDDTYSSDPLTKPNTSFLWRRKSLEPSSLYIIPTETNWESLYDTVDVTPPAPRNLKPEPPAVPPRPTLLNVPTCNHVKTIFKKKMPLPSEDEKIYEELVGPSAHNNYEYEDVEPKSDDDYECFDAPLTTKSEEKIYQSLPLPTVSRKQEEPLPPRPSSRESYDTIHNSSNISNCYESIYSTEKNLGETVSNNYESIYGGNNKTETWELASNRDSLGSSGQQSNSLYGRSLSGWANEDGVVYNEKATSDLSSSDKSDEWIDISDNDDNDKEAPGFVIVRERQKNKKTSGWSQKIRNQWNKSHSLDQGEADHHYESLSSKQEFPDYDDFDSFDSDTESENSMGNKNNQNDSGVDMSNSQLPDPPTNQSYRLTKLAESAGKHMRRLRRNWSLTKNDITKSLSRMAKRKSKTESESTDTAKSNRSSLPIINSTDYACPTSNPVLVEDNDPLANLAQELKKQENSDTYENSERLRTNSVSKNKFLNKFKRSISINNSESNNETSQPKSTFYVTETIDVENDSKQLIQVVDAQNANNSPAIRRHSRTVCRPQSPPPPVPIDANQIGDATKGDFKRSTSWYAECGLFRDHTGAHHMKRPNTSWYAEIGLYQTSSSTPSTSSAENSGSTTHVSIKTTDLTDDHNSEEYYNFKNHDYYNNSVDSFGSDTMVEKFSNLSGDIQLRLQDEPLYQFYDAAVLDSVCHDDSSDYDGYEEVGDKLAENRFSLRPSAMQLIRPNKNGSTVARTLWCEIPEVVQSAVLSTLSLHQKKIQEAKFEMITSEASYLNSLNVLTDHFITNLCNSDLLKNEEKHLLFTKIPSVKKCSEKLLNDLEKCWQDNILLHGICDIIKNHAEENFHVYISYCENQILLDSTLKKIKERNACSELLKQLECSSACQSLTLYSFLMLPMQRITRWPLLVDAVLKRLSPQDEEYLSCQYTLATINKIVTQCNEAARNMERETEIKRIALQIEFPRNIPFIKLASGSRWLIRSGPLIQMQSRGDDVKLTFGKRFSKINLHLFLFNNLLLVTKPRSDDSFVVVHYCFRSYIEVNVSDTIGSLPTKDMQGRNLLFLTILENHEGKTIEMLLSCNSVSDKERWFEALSAPKSEDPDETLYECWDCPQVRAVHNYIASQPDELPLSRGDIVNVTRKMADGWFHGERMRDGLMGWFPANYTVEVANPHVRARNLKQRYRLLAFSENYLKSK